MEVERGEEGAGAARRARRRWRRGGGSITSLRKLDGAEHRIPEASRAGRRLIEPVGGSSGRAPPRPASAVRPCRGRRRCAPYRLGVGELGEVGAELVQGLLGEGEHAAGWRRRPGCGECRHGALDGFVHARRRARLRRRQPRPRGRWRRSGAAEDDLAGEPGSGQAGEAEVAGPGHDALLRGGEAEVGVLLGDHAVEDEQQLHAAADREGVDGADPRLSAAAFGPAPGAGSISRPRRAC